MIVFTEGNPSAAELAYNHLGHNDADFAKKIQEVNKTSFAWELFNGSGIYADNRPIWLPENDDAISQQERELILGVLDATPSWERATLAKAQKEGHDIHQLMHQHEANSHLNQLAGTLTGVAAETTFSTGHLGGDLFGEFEEAVKKASSLIVKMAEANSIHVKTELKHEYAQVLKDINQKYPRYLKFLDQRSRHYLNNPSQLMNKLARQPWVIESYIDAKRVAKAARYFKYLKYGGGILLVVSGAYDAYEQWENTHQWEAMAKSVGESLVDFLVGVLIGAGTALVGNEGANVQVSVILEFPERKYLGSS